MPLLFVVEDDAGIARLKFNAEHYMVRWRFFPKNLLDSQQTSHGSLTCLFHGLRTPATDRSACSKVSETDLSGRGNRVGNIGLYEECVARVNYIVRDVGRSNWRGKCAGGPTE